MGVILLRASRCELTERERKREECVLDFEKDKKRITKQKEEEKDRQTESHTLSLGDVIDPDRQIDLYGDGINF